MRRAVAFPFLILPVALLLALTATSPWAFAQNSERTKLQPIRDSIQKDVAAVSRAKLRGLDKTRRSRHSDEAEIAAATEVLALYRLKSGKAKAALKLLTDYAAYSPDNLSTTHHPCFLLYARIMGIDGKLREALKRVNYAVEHTEGCARARALAMLGSLAMDTNNYAEAVRRYKKTLRYGDKFFRPKQVSASGESERVPGAKEWKQLRAQIQTALDTARWKRDVKKYGVGFCNWRKARGLQLSGQTAPARAALMSLADHFPETVYGQGARFHAAECLLEAGRIAQAEAEFRKFTKSEPYGLWRGEALYKLGEIQLRHHYDLREAGNYFKKVVEWVKTARKRDREVELFMVPGKAREIIRPSSTPLKMVKFELVPADVQPRMVINRKTTDWYLDRLAWDAFYNLGFIAAVDGDWDTAKHLWTRAFNLNEQLQKQYADQIGSLHLRLMCAVRGRCFVARPYELEAYDGYQDRRHRLKLMLADFDALRLKWNSAERLYRDLINDRSTTDEQKAVALRCLGTAMFFQERRGESRKIMEELVEKYAKYPSSYKALVRLGKLHQKDLEKSMALFKQAEEVAPNDDEAALALLHAGISLQYTHGKYDEARKTWREVIQKYPESRWADMSEKRIIHSYKREKERKNRE